MTAPIQPLVKLGPALTGHFTQLLKWVQHATVRISEGDCGAISEAAEKIQQVFEGLAAPVIDQIKRLANHVSTFFSGLWERFGSPVWQFLQSMGGEAWENIQQVGQWIWKKTASFRESVFGVVNPAWKWIKNKLGIGEGAVGQDGILQWFQRKAQSVWDKYIKPFYEEYRKQILVIAGVLVLLSPAGPIIAIGAATAGLAAGIRWISQNLRNREAIVEQRGFLQGVIIPGILGAVNGVSAFLMKKAQFISGKLTEVVTGLNQAIGSTVGSVLGFTVRFLRWILDRFQELVIWANQKLMDLVTTVTEVLDGLKTRLQPVLEVLSEIARVVGDIWRLPMLLAGRVWHAIPGCIRDPFINYFIPLILRQIAFFRELATSPEVWQQTRAQVMGLIRQVFHDFDLLGAIRSVFNLVVRALRIPLELMGQLLDKAANAWDAVIAAPLRFIESAMKSILQGVGFFMSNILSHLGAGVQGWLFNAVSNSGISASPPTSWTNFRSVFGFVLDVSGISVNHVIGLVDRRIPGAGRYLRAGVRFMSGALSWLKIAIEQGPRGLWQHLVERLDNLGNRVLESAINWVMTRVIAIVGVRLVALLASAGLTAVLEAVKAVYNAIQTAIQFMPKIIAILIKVFDSVNQIAAGVIRPAAQTVESGFRMALPVVIGFLANYAGLGGIGGRIVEIIQDVKQQIDDAILWLIDGGITAIRGVVSMARRGVRAVVNWWEYQVIFSDRGGKAHRLFFSGQGETARLKVRSEEMFTEDFVARIQRIFINDPIAESFGRGKLAACRQAQTKIDTLRRRQKNARKNAPGLKIIENNIQSSVDIMAVNMQGLIDLLPDNKPTNLPVKPGDFVTLPYLGTERKAEILIVSSKRVHFRIASVSQVRQMETQEFQKGWSSGKIRKNHPKGNRETYLGGTPGKASTTGKKLITEKYPSPEKRRNFNNKVSVLWKEPNNWHPLLDCDMSHEPKDAVTYWNETGRYKRPSPPPHHPDVRRWMLDWRNYELKPAEINRSRGARNNEKYLPPAI